MNMKVRQMYWQMKWPKAGRGSSKEQNLRTGWINNDMKTTKQSITQIL